MALYVHNATQTLARTMPLLLVASAALLIPEVREEAQDAYERIVHRPLPPMEPKKPNQLVFWLPLAGLFFFGSKYLPEITGSLSPRTAIDEAAKKAAQRALKEKKPLHPPSSSHLLPDALKEELNNFKHRADAERRERELKTQLESQWVLKDFKLKKKTAKELERDKKLSEAISKHLDWVFHHNGRAPEQEQKGWFG